MTEKLQRIPAYDVSEGINSPSTIFKMNSGNIDFKISYFTYFSLFFLLILFPAMSMQSMDDSTEILKQLENMDNYFFIISTIVFQWMLFSLIFLSTKMEQTGLNGVGLKKFRGIDFAWGIAFFLGASLVVVGSLAWFLAQFGLTIPGEIEFLIPTDTTGRILWVVLSFSAAFCEEIVFRGYLMTRLRLTGKFKTWFFPVVASALAFGVSHSYEGWAGIILISIYGALFSWLYIRTGSLWPGIVAHFFHDFMALFFPW